MRVALLVLSTTLGGAALADCPPGACFAGGGPASTDCFVQWAGITTGNTSCADGSSCDSDGKADGVCTFALQACVNVPDPSGACTAGSLDGVATVKPATSPAAQTLAAALAALPVAGESCTPPGVTLALKVSAAGVKKSATHFVVTAASGGKRDKDKLKLTCLPSTVAPSFENVIQPVFTAKCAIPTCHSGPSPSAGQSLEAGQSYATDVGVHSTNNPRLVRVTPGNVKKSYLAAKILGPTDRTAIMPQGCPGLPPAGGCLTDEDKLSILYWIQNGAPQ
jgi:hypothetical protein